MPVSHERPRRRFARFPATCRVEYQAAADRGIAFTAKLSANGMFLENVQGVSIGAKLVCALHLPDGARPIKLACAVRDSSSRGLGLEFVSLPEHAVRRIRAFVMAQLAPPLRLRAESASANVEEIAAYAVYCFEVGKYDEGLATYRQAIANRPWALELYEGIAGLLFERVTTLGITADAELAELEDFLEQSGRQGESAVLDSLRRQLAPARLRVERGRRQRDASVLADLLRAGAHASTTPVSEQIPSRRLEAIEEVDALLRDLTTKRRK
jgi:hypothetical protein